MLGCGDACRGVGWRRLQAAPAMARLPPPAPSRSSRSSAQSDSESLRNDQRPAGQCVPTQRAAIEQVARSQALDAHAETFEPRSACIHRPGAPPPAGSSVSAPAEPPHGYVRMDMCHEPNTVGTIQRARSASGAMERGSRRVIEWPAAPLAAGDPKALNPFTKRPGDTSVHSAAFDFDLRYQSFGAWNDHAGSFHGYLMAWSQGQTTPGHAVPKTGSATFTGKLIGFVAPTGRRHGRRRCGRECELQLALARLRVEAATVQGGAAPAARPARDAHLRARPSELLRRSSERGRQHDRLLEGPGSAEQCRGHPAARSGCRAPTAGSAQAASGRR